MKGWDLHSVPGHCPSETSDGLKATHQDSQTALFILSSWDKEERFKLIPISPVLTGAVCYEWLDEDASDGMAGCLHCS